MPGKTKLCDSCRGTGRTVLPKTTDGLGHVVYLPPGKAPTRRRPRCATCGGSGVVPLAKEVRHAD